jgi:hypothetical protein
MSRTKKNYPLNYPSDVLGIIDALAFSAGDVVVAGSMSLRSQQYAGDYDMFEEVKSNASTKAKAVAEFVKGIQRNVRQLLALPDCYVGDIKCGEIPEWRVVEGDIEAGKVVGYDAEASRKKLDALKKAGVLTADEVAEYDKTHPRQTLVAIWKSVIVSNTRTQHCGFIKKVWVEVRALVVGLWRVEGRIQKVHS